MSEQLSQDQKDECKEVFDIFDTGKEGLISDSSLGDALRALGVNPTESEVREMIEEINPKGNKIEFNDFIEQYCKILKDPDTEADLLESFKIFDREGKGVIHKDELKYIMTTLGDNFSEQEADDMAREGDSLHGDGFIRIEEFVKMIMKK